MTNIRNRRVCLYDVFIQRRNKYEPKRSQGNESSHYHSYAWRNDAVPRVHCFVVSAKVGIISATNKKLK